MTPVPTTSQENSSSFSGFTLGEFLPVQLNRDSVGWGIIRLYRDAKGVECTENSWSKDEQPETKNKYWANSKLQNSPKSGRTFNNKELSQCSILCVLAVPSCMTWSDFLVFAGDDVRMDVSHFRLLRTSRPNRYMVLMKFRSPQKAQCWYEQWNGRQFGCSADAEPCSVVFVKSVTFQTSDISQGVVSFPSMENDPFVPYSQVSSSETRTSSSSSSMGVFSVVEMPTCPVCLERMDDLSGIMTILCQHVFHCDCLRKWRGSGCPVCRHTHEQKTKTNPKVSKPSCHACGLTADLWICLLCANVGCGRYSSGHAIAHYEETGHAFVMDIVTQYVWDYSGDCYVNDNIDEKLSTDLFNVTLDQTTSKSQCYTRDTSEIVEMLALFDQLDDKLQESTASLNPKHIELFSRQLQRQRIYYEDQLARAKENAWELSTEKEVTLKKIVKLEAQISEIKGCREKTEDSLSQTQRELDKSERKRKAADLKWRQYERELLEEKSLNSALMGKIVYLDQKVQELSKRETELEKERDGLKEENRDLAFFISSRDKLAQEDIGNDVVEGFLRVGHPQDSSILHSSTPPASQKRRNRKRRT